MGSRDLLVIRLLGKAAESKNKLQHKDALNSYFRGKAFALTWNTKTTLIFDAKTPLPMCKIHMLVSGEEELCVATFFCINNSRKEEICFAEC